MYDDLRGIISGESAVRTEVFWDTESTAMFAGFMFVAIAAAIYIGLKLGG